MIGEVDVVLHETDKQSVDELDCCGVEVKVKAAAEIVGYRVDGDVEDLCCWWTGRWSWWEKRRPLPAKAQLYSLGWVAELLAEGRVFEHNANCSQAEEAVQGCS